MSSSWSRAVLFMLLVAISNSDKFKHLISLQLVVAKNWPVFSNDWNWIVLFLLYELCDPCICQAVLFEPSPQITFNRQTRDGLWNNTPATQQTLYTIYVTTMYPESSCKKKTQKRKTSISSGDTHTLPRVDKRIDTIILFYNNSFVENSNQHFGSAFIFNRTHDML